MTAQSQVARARAHLIDELHAGLRAPGAPIVVKETAKLLKLSPTPVREALARLAGEGLVTIMEERNGFAVPRLGTCDLAECLELNRALITAATSEHGPERLSLDASMLQDPAHTIEEVVNWLVRGCDNSRIMRLIGRSGVILAPYRREEAGVIPHWMEDLQCLINGTIAGETDALHVYLQKRIELAPRIVDAVERRHRGSNIFQI